MKRVLFVDDDPGIAILAKHISHKMDVEVDSCYSPDIKLFEKKINDYDAIFIDYLFPPESTCVTLIKSLKAIGYKGIIYLLSNYDPNAVIEDLGEEADMIHEFIQKNDMVKALEGVFNGV